MNFLFCYNNAIAFLIPGHLEKMIDNKEFQSAFTNAKTSLEPTIALQATELLDIYTVRGFQKSFYFFSAPTVATLGVSFLVARKTWQDLKDENQQN